MSFPHESKTYTYKDWLEWEGRWELIDGKSYNMTPAPSLDHQFTVGELFFSLRQFFGGKGCDVFVSPFDVYLSDNQNYANPDHIVQPDISVICNKDQLVEQGCFGPPFLVVEVLSPSTALKDYNDKYEKYQQYGVKEYWIADPANRIIHVNGAQEGLFTRRKTFGEQEVLQSFAFHDLTIDLKHAFR